MLFVEMTSEKSRYFFGLFLDTGIGNGLGGFATDVAGRVAKHHYKGLVIHSGEDISHTPARGIGYLPHKPEEAMGAFVPGS